MTGEDTRVAVVGAGYIGYPLAVILASAGHRVVAVDTNEVVVNAINSGRPLFDEPEIGGSGGDSRGSPQPECIDLTRFSSVFIIAVSTPFDEERHQADLSAVEAAAARSITPHLKAGDLVVVESTVPPGTTPVW